MLVVLFVVEVATVLLDLVDAQTRGVHSLDTEVVGLQAVVGLGAASSCDKRLGDISALDDVVPVVVRPAGVLLGVGEESRLLKSIGNHELDLLPQSLGINSQALDGLLESSERADGSSGIVAGAHGLLGGIAENMLLATKRRQDRRRSRSNEDG